MFLKAIQPFTLELNWLRSQAFRWYEHDGWFCGAINGHPVKVRNSQGGIEFQSIVPEESLADRVSNYFRLDQEVDSVHASLRRVDSTMSRLVDKYGGLRLLQQDPWECLASYICSQNNSIDRIAGITGLLAERYGTPMAMDGIHLYSFPQPQTFVEAGEAELKKLHLGLNRGSRLYELAGAVVSGELNLDSLRILPYVEAKNRLISYQGLGQKIADCVCLFSLDKAEAFPVDRHIGGALLELYGRKYTPGAKNVGLLRWAQSYFGDHAGYAGQLLFYDNLGQGGQILS